MTAYQLGHLLGVLLGVLLVSLVLVGPILLVRIGLSWKARKQDKKLRQGSFENQVIAQGRTVIREALESRPASEKVWPTMTDRAMERREASDSDVAVYSECAAHGGYVSDVNEACPWCLHKLNSPPWP